jgi:signal transduction histidine kinase
LPARALGLNYAQATILLIAAGAIMLVMLVLSAYRLANETSDQADSIAAERLIRIAARQTQLGLVNAETGQRGFLLTGESDYLAPYVAGTGQAREGLAALMARVRDPEDLEAVAEIRRSFEPKLEEMARTIELTRAGRREEAMAIVKGDRGKVLMDVLRRPLEAITARADRQIELGLSDVARSAHRLLLTTALGAALLVAFAVLAFLIVKRNTGQLVEAQQSLEALTDELEERVQDRTLALTRANDEIQRFAYIVSHDLRAPLVNIMGFTSELETASNRLGAYFGNENASEADRAEAVEVATSEIPESVGFIRSSSTKMDGLIGAILKLSREGRRELTRERVQLSDVVEAAVASLQHQIEEAGATVVVEPPLASVVSDRLALDQIVGNIIDNAVKYLAPGRPGRITISSQESGGRVKLQIADNGRGIAETDLARIFELFRRAGRQDRPGEGIGLAHVRSLVRMLGGDVTAQSRLGEGTTFVIDLPKKMVNHSAKEKKA